MSQFFTLEKMQVVVHLSKVFYATWVIRVLCEVNDFIGVIYV